MKKFFGPLLTAGTMLALLYTVYGYREQNEKLKSERETLTKHMVDSHAMAAGDIGKANLMDSLHDELFNAKVEAGRYELSLEHLYEVNPKAGKMFTEFMEHETE